MSKNQNPEAFVASREIKLIRNNPDIRTSTSLDPSSKYSDLLTVPGNTYAQSNGTKDPNYLQNDGYGTSTKSHRRPLLRLDSVGNKSKALPGILPMNNYGRQQSTESIDSSQNNSPEGSPRLLFQQPGSARSAYSGASAFNKTSNRVPQKSSLSHKAETAGIMTERSDDKYFFRMTSTPVGFSQSMLRPSTALRTADKSFDNQIPDIGPQTTLGRFASSGVSSKKFYSSLRKPVVVKEEPIINKPIASTILVQNMGIKEKMQHLLGSLENSGRLTMSMRNLHEFLELIQNLAYLMKASIDTFQLVQTSVEEVAGVAQQLSKHPSRESILKICNWVHSSRCYELNLKELCETCHIEESSTTNQTKKKFDEVQINYLVLFLISYIQDFEKLLTISKQRMTQEVLIREKEVIPRTIRQADVICQCISDMLIEDFRNKKIYLVSESKNLVSGLYYSLEAVRTAYTKIRMNVEESLEIYKSLYHKIKNFDKNMEGFFEMQRVLKDNVEKFKDQIRALQDLLNEAQCVEQNVIVFNDKFTEGIETLKKILSFKLKVENIETLFQMPQIEKKLGEHLDALNQYFIRAKIPDDERIVAVHSDLELLPPIKNSFSLFVSYFQDLLKSQIYHELFSESFIQLKTINDSVRELYTRVDEQFETFVKSYFSSLVHAAAKHKRAMKNEYWKILTWNDFSNDLSLENSISKVTNSVKIIRNSLMRSKLIQKHNYKNVLEKSDTLEENMRIWTEEVEFADHFLTYLDRITTLLLRPLTEFNHEYEESKLIKARFDGVLLSYIKLKNSTSFEELCSNVSSYIRGKQHDERQDFLRDFEDSLLRYHLETFFKSFFKKLHTEFKKYFVNILIPIPSSRLQQFKTFIESCKDVLASLCEQPTISRLPQLSNLFQRRQEDLQMVTFMMEQILLVNNKSVKTLTTKDEANIRSASQSVLFKYLLESIHSYDALYGKLNPTLRANELENQMQKLEEQISKGEFEKEELEDRLTSLEKRTNETLEEMNELNLLEGERSPARRKETMTIKNLVSDIMARAGKLRRKVLKMATQKQLNELHLLEEECKKVIQVSIHNRHDCYDIKVFGPSVVNIREKVEDFKQNREHFGDEEVIEEILEDLDGNLDTLLLIGSTGEKLELTITGKLEGLNQVQACAETLRAMRDELSEKLRKVEFLNAEMRTCTQEQWRNIELVEEYLSNVYEGIKEIKLEALKDDELLDSIRQVLSECFEVNFLEHPAFKDKMYSPDVEAIKQEIELIRAGVENLTQLLRIDNLAIDETVIFSYEQASTMEGWLEESILQLFRNLVVITRLHGFLTNVSSSLCGQILNGGLPDLAEATEKLQQGKELYATLQEHEEEFQHNLQIIDTKSILRGKLQFIEHQLKFLNVLSATCRIQHEINQYKDRHYQFSMVNERKSLGDQRREFAQELSTKLATYYKDIKMKNKGVMSEDEYMHLLDSETTFEVFAHDIEQDLRRGRCHLMGTMEDEFFFRMNPEKLGSRASLKDSQMFSKILREIRSVLRRKSIFEVGVGAKFQVDILFSMVYKTSQGNIIAMLDLVSNGQVNVKGVLVTISRDGTKFITLLILLTLIFTLDIKRIYELNEDVVDDVTLNYKVSDLIIST